MLQISYTCLGFAPSEWIQLESQRFLIYLLRGKYSKYVFKGIQDMEAPGVKFYFSSYKYKMQILHRVTQEVAFLMK